LAVLRRVLERDPGIAVAEASMGPILARMGEGEAAIAAYRRALALDPRIVGVAFNLGTLLMERYEIDGAIEALAAAARLEPGSAEVFMRLGAALFRQGRHAEAERAYRRALALRPGDPRTHSNLVYLCLHAPGPPSRAAEEARAWGRRHATVDPAAIAPHTNTRDPERRLRIGYVSPDLRNHPIAFFIEPLLAAHDRTRVEIFAYAEVPRPDAVTARLRALCDHWRSTVGIDDAAVAAQIRADGIDILVDQASHTANSRLTLFGLRPAPVQATWLGGGGSTGVPTIDYMIGDILNLPPGSEPYHTEQFVRLPPHWGTLAGDHVAAPRSPLPALANGFVTFGSFNRLEKIHGGVIEAWARVLRAVPGARLLMKTFALGEAGTRRRIAAAFAAARIDPQRLIMEPPSRGDAYLARYAAIDVMLDPFPYTGGTITVDSLLAGVPVVTLKGLLRTSTMSERTLLRVERGDMVAADLDEYVAIAARLAADLPRLVRLREEIPEIAWRRLTERKPLKAIALEAAYRRMWQRWCAGLPPAPITIEAATADPSGGA